MLEKTHIAGVVRQLKKLDELHSQSMTYGSLSMNGTPDRYFDGRARDLWIEFKRLTRMPRSGSVVGDYSDLQLKWMNRRWYAINGCNMWGAVGLPDGRICLQTHPEQWEAGTPVETAISHKQLAELIMEFCNGVKVVREGEPVQVRSNSPGHRGLRSTRR